jgi:tetratricopeptide (TPR) repeat protein
MNRKQRRAMHKQGGGAGIQGGHARAAPEPAADRLLDEAVTLQRRGKLNEAIRAYKRLLALRPGHADACNNLGFIYVAQGNLKEARVRFRQVLIRRPQLLFDFASVCALLVMVNPTMREGMQRAADAWPQRQPALDLLRPSGIAAIVADPVLAHVLTSTIVRHVDLERLLTSIRLDLLRTASAAGGDRVEESVLGFCCALARQCFINEYVFAAMPEEEKQAEQLKGRLVETLEQGSRIPPIWVAAQPIFRCIHCRMRKHCSTVLGPHP